MKLSSYIAFWNKEIASLLSPTGTGFPMSLGVSIQKDYIPEPFMGDPTPNSYSFVIVNLNPGTGVCHSCIKQQNVGSTLIHKVKTMGYSVAVKDFPYLQKGTDVGLIDWDDSPGRKWWEGKERWIKHMISVCNPSYNSSDPILDGYYPFAMELFAWHTKSWPNTLNKKMESSGVHGSVVYSDVIEPLYEAIKGSKYKFAFCVGKPIGNIIGSFPLFSKKNKEPIQPIGSINRFYDIYFDNKGCYIINTWAPGGNTYPSEKYYEKEEELVKSFKK